MRRGLLQHFVPRNDNGLDYEGNCFSTSCLAMTTGWIMKWGLLRRFAPRNDKPRS
jgi:hypothetical protein